MLLGELMKVLSTLFGMFLFGSIALAGECPDFSVGIMAFKCGEDFDNKIVFIETMLSRKASEFKVTEEDSINQQVVQSHGIGNEESFIYSNSNMVCENGGLHLRRASSFSGKEAFENAFGISLSFLPVFGYL